MGELMSRAEAKALRAQSEANRAIFIKRRDDKAMPTNVRYGAAVLADACDEVIGDIDRYLAEYKGS
ncbi:hypothetical protein [Bradyrhizobium sp. SZCCHNRI1002]|uniref:hypothetical protein n=1 Tax=Bradyrhizobium sp. SZCCHNRI1002 TaxID=3057274 RepID=UPI0028E73B62|nr:hypothetical protein [Bradyrhizobium sp. SZCCHNRI1002]